MKKIALFIAAYCLLYAIFSCNANKPRHGTCARCEFENDLLYDCPCCSSYLCESCYADIEYEIEKREEYLYNNGWNDGYTYRCDEEYRERQTD